MDKIYANKYTVTLTENEGILRFGWVVPKYNEKDEVVGGELVDEKIVVLPRSGYDELLRLMSELSAAGAPKN